MTGSQATRHSDDDDAVGEAGSWASPAPDDRDRVIDSFTGLTHRLHAWYQRCARSIILYTTHVVQSDDTMRYDTIRYGGSTCAQKKA